MRKARPKAAAACGTERSGDNIRSMMRNARDPLQAAQIRATSKRDSAVAANPVVMLSVLARVMPGQSNNISNALSVSPSPPSAGM